jgi:putative hydrolase of the HAD superfamily
VSRAPVRALFFDVGGTLLRPWPSVGAIYAATANRHGLSGTPEQMEHAFRESWAALKRPGLTVSRKEWWRELVFRALGQENEACFQELFELFARPDAWRVFPDVESTLREARNRDLHVGVISNWDERLRPLLEGIGLTHWFDSMTISCEVGVEKPDAAIFQAALRTAGLNASEALHVGDAFDADVKAAESMGMRAVLLQRDSSRQPSHNTICDLRSVLDYL